jgi:glycine oxidase
LSKSPDCIVVGGGVIGLTIARRLANDGLTVTLLERAQVGREASWAGAGVLAPPNPHRKDAAAVLHRRSLAMYPDFCAGLLDETGIDPEYERSGELELAFDDQGLSALRSDVQAGSDHVMPDGRAAYEIHSAEQTRSLEPLVSPNVVGSMECRETAQARNPRLLRALQSACTRTGVDMRENIPVQDFLIDDNRVTGVQTETGTVCAPNVVLCAGAWSSQIGDRLRTLMPVHPVRGQMVLMKLDERPFERVVSRGKTYLVPRRDGHVLLGATEEPKAGFTNRNTAKGIAGLIEKGLKLVPSLGDAPLEATWAGLRPGTPDDKPYIGRVPGFDGLIAATGHYRSGLSLAPATAEVVAAIITGRAYDLDLSCCRPGRSA